MRMSINFSKNSSASNIFFLILYVLSIASCLVFLASCRSYTLEKKLDSESKEFLTKVRYIITSEEHKIFIKLPLEEREMFIEEFWKRRDPSSDTDENEFKDAYLNRIKEANELFGVGQAGFLTDRGMIYILFGSPDDIHQSQIFMKRMGYDQEVWLYSRLIDKYTNMRINFIDRLGTGNFELVRSSSIYSIIQEAKLYYVNLASKKRFFRYDLNLKTLEEKGNEAELLIQIKIPYKNIWFSSLEDKMETTLSLKIEISDALKNKIWEYKQDYLLSFLEKEAEQFIDKNHLIEIPITLTKGNYLFQVNLGTKNGETAKRVFEIRI